MIAALDLGHLAITRNRQLSGLIRNGSITLGGCSRSRIYGTLACTAGKTMNMRNKVFFTNEAEALDAGYRPCARCLNKAYLVWKARLSIAQ